MRTLNQMLRRQGKALGQYESKEERFPTLLHQSDEEIRVMREQLRTARQKYIQLREQYRLLENYAQAAEREREKLSSMVRDKELLDSKALKKERDDLLSQLTALGTKTKVKSSKREVLLIAVCADHKSVHAVPASISG